MIPSQLSITDLVIYVCSGVYLAFLVIMLIPGVDIPLLASQLGSLSAAEGFLVAVPGLFALYLLGAIAVALGDLVSATFSRNGTDAFWGPCDGIHTMLVLAIHPGIAVRRKRALGMLENFRKEFICAADQAACRRGDRVAISSGGLAEASLFPCAVSPSGDDLISRAFTLRTFHKTVAVLSWLAAILLIVGTLAGWYFAAWRIWAIVMLILLGILAAFRSDRLYMQQIEIMVRNGYFWLANPAIEKSKF